MGTKPAKVGRMAPCLLNQGSNPGNTRVHLKKSQVYPVFRCFGLFSQKGLRSVGGTKLLKWGLPGRGSNLLESPRLLYVYSPPCSCCFSRERLQKLLLNGEACQRPLL